jgi:hypothetical protein
MITHRVSINVLFFRLQHMKKLKIMYSVVMFSYLTYIAQPPTARAAAWYSAIGWTLCQHKREIRSSDIR